MFVPAPIDKKFVPYNKRIRMQHDADLFVDSNLDGRHHTLSVVPQTLSVSRFRGGDCCAWNYHNGIRACAAEWDDVQQMCVPYSETLTRF